MLFIISTPIGNLGDLTFRAVETMLFCDLLLCEDTRKSRILLNHYGIDKKLAAYHEHNERRMVPHLIKNLLEGQKIGLLTDGGTPLVSDPGYLLVRACRTNNIPVTALPGPTALITALTISSFPCHCFQFIGFLPRKKSARAKIYADAMVYDGTTIAYESPYRLMKTLEELLTSHPNAIIGVARELTKLHEEFRSGSPRELFDHFTQYSPKGEFVLLFQREQHPIVK